MRVLRVLGQSMSLVTVLSVAVSSSAAQAPDTAWVVGAVRTTTPPRIDGKDDDEVWKSIKPVTVFREYSPREAAAPAVATAYRVAYDQRNLYVLVRAFDPHPDSIAHALTRRDGTSPSDQIGVILDGYHDHRTGFEFVVNPDGVKSDYAIYDDSTEDATWDGVWSVATTVDSLGWLAEFRIPFSQLRYADAKRHTFGFAIWRLVQRSKEFVAWPLYRPSKTGLASQLGHLTGVDDIASARAVELTPYTIARNASRPASTGFARHSEASVGGDVRYGITSSATLDATINPDFGQVDADPSLVNLTAFETFLAERRPFFLEGVRLYQFPVNCNSAVCNNEGLFYSRRIGRAPQLAGVYGDATSPGGTPIAAAAKITGRSQHGLMIGVLDALTDAVAGSEHRTIEPSTNYAEVRAQQDLAGGSFGVIATAVDRSLDELSAPLLRRTAYVGGPDLRYDFGGGQYEISGSATASRVGGSPAAIAATQRNDVHDFQRPDGATAFDSTRASLTGTAQELIVGKYGGGITRFQTTLQEQSPGYEINDLGYLQRADERTWSNQGAIVVRTPSALYQRVQLTANQWTSWSWAGLRIQSAVGLTGHLVLGDNGTLDVGATADQLAGSACDRCARGGPALRMSPRVAPAIGWSGDPRRIIVPRVNVAGSTSDGGRSRMHSVTVGADLHPSPALQLGLGLSVSNNRDNTQWYANVADSARQLHYLFAQLTQRTSSLTVRGSYALSRDVTLEVYTQPFVSAGTFADIRELSATPRASSYDARFQPDARPASEPTGFDIRQVRSNSVVRWEYRPGSTIFLVWTHARDDAADTDPGRSWDSEFRSLLALRPDNTFLIKAAYWVGR